MKKNGLKKINLALQGGGAHGALAWGVLDALLQDDRLEIDSICATSAGAINAVILAGGFCKGGRAGARHALSEFWHAVCEYGISLSPVKRNAWEEWFNIPLEYSFGYGLFNYFTRLLSPYQFNPLNYNPLQELLERYVDFDNLKQAEHLKLFICATNVKTGKIKVFEQQDISIQAILASTCLPYLFQAVEIDGESYWDGGYMGNPAIFPLIYNSAIHDILIIHINPVIRATIPRNAVEILNRINEISFNSSLMREMRAIAFITKLIDQDWLKEKYRNRLKRIYLHSIRTDEIMEHYSVASKFNTDWNFISTLFELGSNAAKKWLKQNFGKIGKESSMDVAEFL